VVAWAHATAAVQVKVKVTVSQVAVAVAMVAAAATVMVAATVGVAMELVQTAVGGVKIAWSVAVDPCGASLVEVLLSLMVSMER